jgi:putative transposase
MANYRRIKVAGGTYFFTVVTHRRRRLFDQAQNRRMLHDAVQEVRKRHPFTIDA